MRTHLSAALLLTALTPPPALAGDRPAAFERHADRVVCLPQSPNGLELPDFAWNGSRFIMTWYERTTPAPRAKSQPPPTADPPSFDQPPAALTQPPPPPNRRPPPGRPPPGRPPRAEAKPLAAEPTHAMSDPPPPPHRRPPPDSLLDDAPEAPQTAFSFEQKTALVELDGSVLGASQRDATPVDGAASLMGRLAFNGADLGLAYMDDGSGERTAMFRRLDATGAPLGQPFAVSTETLPHGDNVAVAWNPTVESWGVLRAGTFGQGNVTNHVFLSRFRGSTPGASLRLDAADSSDTPSPNSALAVAGPCFVASWADYPEPHVTLGEVCGTEPVRRVNVSETMGVQPMQSTVAVLGSKALVAWVDRDSEQGDLSADVRFSVATLDAKALAVIAHGRLKKKGWAQAPHVVADAASFWMTWNEDDEVWVAHLGPDGKLLEPERAVGPRAAGPTWSRLVVGGKRLFVAVSSPNTAQCQTSLIEVAAVK